MEEKIFECILDELTPIADDKSQVEKKTRKDVREFLARRQLATNKDMVDKLVTSNNEQVNGVTLSDEQQSVVNELKEFIRTPYNPDRCVAVLVGNAGTGKSLSMKALVNYMKGRIRYKLCAPTHKAKYILSKYTGEAVETIHSLLRLSPKIDVQDLDYKNLKFVEKDDKNPKIPKKGLILIDECSMVNSALFDAFLRLSREKMVKIILVGDDKQIQPVNEGGLSPAFTKSHIFLKLTKVFRQDGESALVPILIKLRDEAMYEFETVRAGKGSLIVDNDVKEFIRPCVSVIRNSIESMDTDATKILCYRNAQVRAYNRFIRRCLLKNDADNIPFMKGEFLVGYENFEYEKHNFYNSSDYIINDEPRRGPVVIPDVGIVNGWIISIYDKVEDASTWVPMLDIKTVDQEVIYTWIARLEDLRLKALQAKEAKNGRDKMFWGMYFKTLQCCAINEDLVFQNRIVKKKTFDYGYALTTHKSQGSSYTNVFVDMSDLFCNQDKDELRQLQYVSISRTRSDVHLLIKQ